MDEKQLKELEELSKKTGITETKLIRIAREDLLYNRKRSKVRLWSS